MIPVPQLEVEVLLQQGWSVSRETAPGTRSVQSETECVCPGSDNTRSRSLTFTEHWSSTLLGRQRLCLPHAGHTAGRATQRRSRHTARTSKPVAARVQTKVSRSQAGQRTKSVLHMQATAAFRQLSGSFQEDEESCAMLCYAALSVWPRACFLSHCPKLKFC